MISLFLDFQPSSRNPSSCLMSKAMFMLIYFPKLLSSSHALYLSMLLMLLMHIFLSCRRNWCSMSWKLFCQQIIDTCHAIMVSNLSNKDINDSDALPIDRVFDWIFKNRQIDYQKPYLKFYLCKFLNNTIISGHP